MQPGQESLDSLRSYLQRPSNAVGHHAALRGLSPLPHIQRQSIAGKEGEERHRNVRNVAKSFNSRAQAMPPSQALVQHTPHQGTQEGDSESSWCVLAPIFLKTETLWCPPHFWLYFEGLPYPSWADGDSSNGRKFMSRSRKKGHKCPEKYLYGGIHYVPHTSW